MICTISKHRAENKGYADALMLDWEDYVAECTGANIFFIKDGVVHTPLADRFLNGITRQTVIDLAHRRGFEVIERRIKPEEMEGFSECFITGSAAEVTPVSEIGPYRFTPASMTKTLMGRFTPPRFSRRRSRPNGNEPSPPRRGDGSEPLSDTLVMKRTIHERGRTMKKKQATDENENPKTAGGDASNRIKDPSEWTTGDEPMTGAQAFLSQDLVGGGEITRLVRAGSGQGRGLETDRRAAQGIRKSLMDGSPGRGLAARVFDRARADPSRPA